MLDLALKPGETLHNAHAGADIAVYTLLGEFSIAPTAKFDITDNAIVINSADPDVVANGSRKLDRGPGQEQVLNRHWTGTGIHRAAPPGGDEGIRLRRTCGQWATPRNGSLPLGPYTEFHGMPADQDSVLVAYTRTGDANLDGLVNNDDVTIMGVNYAPGVPKPHWALGDFDYNGFVDNDDVTLLGVFYDPTASPIPAPLEAVQSPRSRIRQR